MALCDDVHWLHVGLHFVFIVEPAALFVDMHSDSCDDKDDECENTDGNAIHARCGGTGDGKSGYD